MTDPFLDSLATALVGQAATALTAAGAKALVKVRDLLRRRSDEDPETLAALEAAENDPGEPQIKALAERLDRASQEDAEFAEQLRTEGAQVHHDIRASDDSVVNVNHGNVDKLIQAREIHGGITFN
ncbi:hypothetical protein [Saccharopolyspora taberi]|uniref:RHIM domain-containing protein n=1 Tax=Saccharopolyspora taberi TaxID=60895 RepID=A0ABN3VDM4_9PSEU